MRDVLVTMVNTIDSITKWSGYLLAGLVTVMALIVGYEVGSRYFFDKPTNWAMELTTMIFGTYMLGAGAWATLKGGHVNMDIFYNKWSPRTKALSNVLTFPLIVVFLMVILFKSSVFSLESISNLEHSHSAWGPPIYHWKATLPVALFLIVMQYVANFIRSIYLVITGGEL